MLGGPLHEQLRAWGSSRPGGAGAGRRDGGYGVGQGSRGQGEMTLYASHAQI